LPTESHHQALYGMASYLIAEERRRSLVIVDMPMKESDALSLNRSTFPLSPTASSVGSHVNRDAFRGETNGHIQATLPYSRSGPLRLERSASMSPT